jgi:cyanate lyase
VAGRVGDGIPALGCGRYALRRRVGLPRHNRRMAGIGFACNSLVDSRRFIPAATKRCRRMTKTEMKIAILDAKKAKGMTWEALAGAVGLSSEFLCSACLGMNSLTDEKAKACAETLGLGPDVASALTEFPMKTWDQVVPTDPLIYRWYEIVGVYGETIKELIHEQFGDGIMSAIDFTLNVDKQEDPKGDRVVVTLNGKFLPYKSW